MVKEAICRTLIELYLSDPPATAGGTDLLDLLYSLCSPCWAIGLTECTAIEISSSEWVSEDF